MTRWRSVWVSPFCHLFESIRQLSRLYTGYSSNYLMVNDPVFDAFQPKAIVATTEDEVKQILRDATVSINEYMNDNIKVV